MDVMDVMDAMELLLTWCRKEGKKGRFDES